VRRDKIDSRPLEKKRTVTFDKLLDAIALGNREPEVLESLAGRLVRLEKRFDEALGNEVRTTAKGQTLCEIAQTMLGAINPDNVEAKAKEGKDQYFQPTEKDLQVAQANGPPEILAVIAELCQKHDVIAITDGVYEHILYDDAIHTRLATLPGMAERTLTISSLGKTFSVTGWKIGWALGPASWSTRSTRRTSSSLTPWRRRCKQLRRRR
jgi:hypothetical protein